MPNYDANVVTPRQAEEILKYAISEGESLLFHDEGDFSKVLTWSNLVDLALEFIPSCRKSLRERLDLFKIHPEPVKSVWQSWKKLLARFIIHVTLVYFNHLLHIRC